MIGIQGGPWLNNFDLSIESFFSHTSEHVGQLNIIILQLDKNYLLRSGLLMMLVWLALFDRERPGRLRKDFELLIGASLMGAVGTLVARLMAHFLPYRARPFTVSFLQYPTNGWDLPKWGCFPSDHAVLFVAIACGIFFVSRRLGYLAIGWVALGICLPRLYLGEHWPTDILVGCAMGVAFSSLAKAPAFRDLLRRKTLEWNESHPQVFLTALFLWTFSVATVFSDVRSMGIAMLTFVKHG